jgi:copper chaperone CopZ
MHLDSKQGYHSIEDDESAMAPQVLLRSPSSQRSDRDSDGNSKDQFQTCVMIVEGMTCSAC